MKAKSKKKSVTPSTITAKDVHGARECLLHGLRATGSGLGVLAIEDGAFHDMVANDDEYRTMIVEISKLMFIQADYDATCSALATKAREKMIAALIAHGDWSVKEAFGRPVDFSKIPLMGSINIDHVNNLRPEWLGSGAMN